jgi:hypothetical protein
LIGSAALEPEDRSQVLVCTISRDGTPTMNALVRRTMERLAAGGYRVAAVHLEQGDIALSALVRETAERAYIAPAPRSWNPISNARAISAGLLAGVRDAAADVAAGSARALVYLEGDKFDFPTHIPELVEPILSGRAELNVATRSPAGLAGFPAVQRAVESAFDRYISRETGVRIDCLYGPRAYSPVAAALFADYRADDWGVVVYPMVIFLARGRGFTTLEVPGAPPPDYMKKYDRLMRPAPAHLAWRLVQNLGNWRAARAALARARANGEAR